MQVIRSMWPKGVVVAIFTLIIAIEGGVLLFGEEWLRGIPMFPQDCLEKPDGYERWDCLNGYFEKLTQATSANIALTESLALVKQGVIVDCHVSAHTIGRVNLEKHDFNMGEAFASCGFQCIQGCMHGVMERYLQNEADPYRVLSEIKNMCDSVGSISPGVWNKDALLWDQCNHGIGHGLLQHGFFSLEESVGACMSFDHPIAEERCIAGVMMENINQYLTEDESYLREILPKVCAGVEKMKEDEATYGIWKSCIANLSLGLMWYTGHDIQRSQQLCEGLLQEPDETLCRRYVIIFTEGRNTRITDVPF